jgi:hypothetical protein
VSARATSRGRPGWPLILLAVAVLGVVFLLGVGLGLALEERPQTGGTRTSVRTFRPPEVPPTRTAATGTVSVP